ncbi:MAG TPA: transcription antitermination factor NusB [Acidimicrobiales bacterium]|nr:transcription antitermination factor NusB [Acidimicrobiales bacterium]
MPEPASDGEVVGVSRLDARERALELLYEADLKDRTVTEILEDLPIPADPFTIELVSLADAHRDEVDADLMRVSRGWTLDRMPVVDRAILRVGIAELRWAPETPTAVVINEAVELAKRFSTDASSRYVNGVLSRIAADHRGGPSA